MNLICKADSFPASSYEIKKSETSVSNSTSGFYRLTGVTQKDEGMYSCTPRNEIGGGKTKLIQVEIGSMYSHLGVAFLTVH